MMTSPIATIERNTDFFGGFAEEATTRFPGTIVVSEVRQGDKGAYWQMVIYNEDNGRFESQTINNANKTNPRAWLKSKKHLIEEAFKKLGIVLGQHQAVDFVGYRGEFESFVKENKDFDPTFMWLPVSMDVPGAPDKVAELRGLWEARVSRGGRTESANTRTLPNSTTNEPTYTVDQISYVAELLNGASPDDVVVLAMKEADVQIRAGLLDGSLVSAALGAGALDIADDGTYVAVEVED